MTEEIGLDPQRLYVTCFIGAPEYNIAKDTGRPSYGSRSLPKKASRLDWPTLVVRSKVQQVAFTRASESSFMMAARTGGAARWARNYAIGDPCGPDSEMFYEFDFIEHDPKFAEHCHPNCDCGRFMEIGNNVFMAYAKRWRTVCSNT